MRSSNAFQIVVAIFYWLSCCCFCCLLTLFFFCFFVSYQIGLIAGHFNLQFNFRQLVRNFEQAAYIFEPIDQKWAKETKKKRKWKKPMRGQKMTDDVWQTHRYAAEWNLLLMFITFLYTKWLLWNLYIFLE